MEEIKQYLLKEFPNPKYKRRTIIYIFLNDKPYYKSLEAKGLIEQEVTLFLNRREVPLKNAESISIEAFKRLKYEQIIDEYIEKFVHEDNKRTEDDIHNMFVAAVRKTVPKDYIPVQELNSGSHLHDPKELGGGVKKEENLVHLKKKKKTEAGENRKKKEKQAKKAKNKEKQQKQPVSKSHRTERTDEAARASLQKYLENFRKNQVIREKDEHTYQPHDEIGIEDFVVRRTTFKCRYRDHKLINIDGIIKMIDKNGNEFSTNVAAGFCPTCNRYFIMESVYQNLKMKGTPMCRISDEKCYLQEGLYGGELLAKESILMQYGYNVSQEENLSAARRRKILSVLVDNNILTRNDIISYIDFFINQRKNQSRFEKAIEKWRSDREFISEYRIGNYKQYGVNGIYRKY